MSVENIVKIFVICIKITIAAKTNASWDHMNDIKINDVIKYGENTKSDARL